MRGQSQWLWLYVAGCTDGASGRGLATDKPADSVPYIDTGGRYTPDTQMDYDADGYVAADDCNNSDATVHPNAVELCNGIDDDCDGTADEVDDIYLDEDGDGFGSHELTVCEVVAPSVQVALAGDCDDNAPEVYPGAPDADCDQIDQDCDGEGAEAARFEDGSVFVTVQEALDAAGAGEIITLCSGRHAEHLSAPLGSNFELSSYNSDPYTTFFDGEGSGRILSIDGSEVRINNVGFLNGYVHFEGEPGEGEEDGAAILAKNSNVTVVGSYFGANQADYGAAISIGSADSRSHPVDRFLTISSSVFEDNLALDRGGDLYAGGDAYGLTAISIDQSLFSGSTAGREGGAICLAGGFKFSFDLKDSLLEYGRSGDLGGCAYISVRFWEVTGESGPIDISGTTFSNCSSAYGGAGALYIGSSWTADPTIPVTISDSQFIQNSTIGPGAAIELKGNIPIAATLTDVLFDTNISTEGGSAFSSVDETLATITCERCTFHAGDGGPDGGAVDIDDFAQLDVVDSDWGAGATDNSPYDLVKDGISYSGLEMHETFTCSPGLGCSIPAP